MSYIGDVMKLGPLQRLSIASCLAAVLCIVGSVRSEEARWRQLADGLEIAHFSADHDSATTDSALTVIRVDPARWEFKLLGRSLNNEPENLTARQWCEKYDLVAAINAGMFQQDYSTHVGYLNAAGKIAARRVRSYQSAVAFGPKRDSIAAFRVFDLDKDSLGAIVRDYDNVCQNMRLISRPGENRWSQQERRWTEVALGEDEKGRALLIFCGRALSMHDFNKRLLSLPIGVVTAQHLEGGPEAQLYLKTGEVEIERLGSFGSGFNESYSGTVACPIPNVIGVARKTR